ncbi:MAG: STAS domain-containing protein [Candidatus Krumholzibacteria bacterium]|nr:STAS domain-containing protein [Candidatus Krumholzibacteria bacterium]
MADQLKLTWDTNYEPVPVLQLHGRLDADGAQQLQDAALASLRGGESVNLVVDLEGVEFVASTGLATFLLLVEIFNESQGIVVFVKAAPAVMQVISLLNIDQFLKLENSTEAAVQLIGAEADSENLETRTAL